MTTLNTIIEEEKKEFDAKFREKIDFVNYCLSEGDTMFDSNDVKTFLTTALQRAYEAGREDEQWDKEREYARGCTDGANMQMELLSKAE